MHWPYGDNTHFEARIHPGNATMRTPQRLAYPGFVLNKHPRAGEDPRLGWQRVPKKFFAAFLQETHAQSGLPVIQFREDRKGESFRARAAAATKERIQKQAGLNESIIDERVTAKLVAFLRSTGAPEEQIEAFLEAEKKAREVPEPEEASEASGDGEGDSDGEGEGEESVPVIETQPPSTEAEVPPPEKAAGTVLSLDMEDPAPAASQKGRGRRKSKG